jgi:hypothetical protein
VKEDESKTYMSNVSAEYGRLEGETLLEGGFKAVVVDRSIVMFRADARDRFRSRRAHSSSQLREIGEGGISDWWRWPLRVTACSVASSLTA